MERWALTPGLDETARWAFIVGAPRCGTTALSEYLRGHPEVRTFAFLSDGELEEGQVWEAAMFAGHYRLGRLTVLLDANNSQVDGPVASITTIEPVAAKWRAFGWDAVKLDGHDVDAVAAALASGADGVASPGRPRAEEVSAPGSPPGPAPPRPPRARAWRSAGNARRRSRSAYRPGSPRPSGSIR